MVTFICDRCGKCCVSLGRYITVERRLNGRDYYCRSHIDNTLFLAHVDPAFREEIAGEVEAGDTSVGSETKPCQFLRKDPSGNGRSCAIYASRPKVCRDFRCYHTIIRNHEGAVCGRVIGKNTLRTEDPVLESLWSEEVLPLPVGNTRAWRESVGRILATQGYAADPVE